MYFTDIGDEELNLFHNKTLLDFKIFLNKALISNLFKVETIISGNIYKVYPLFYCDSITSTNPNDIILDNKCIICTKKNDTVLSFNSEKEDETPNTIEVAWTGQFDEYGLLVFVYNSTDGKPIENTEIYGEYNDTEVFDGYTNDNGFFYYLQENVNVDLLHLYYKDVWYDLI